MYKTNNLNSTLSTTTTTTSNGSSSNCSDTNNETINNFQSTPNYYANGAGLKNLLIHAQYKIIITIITIPITII